MVGRALERIVERHLQPEVPGLPAEAAEVLDGAQLGCDGGVPALGRADGPRAAGIVGPGAERVVGTLALGDADRVDRRQVDDVEPHVGHGAQALHRAVEAPLAAGEQFVPGPEQGPRAIDPQRERRRLGQVGVGDGRHQAGHPVVEARVQAHVHAARGAPSAPPPRRARAVGRGQPRRPPAPRECGPLLELELHVVAGPALISTSCRQVANRSRQASTTISWRPISVGEITASQRSLPRSSMGAVLQRPLSSRPTCRQRSPAPSRSWPSRKMSAETVTRSPRSPWSGTSATAWPG